MSKNTISDADRKELFGEFSWKRLNGDAVEIANEWESKNIATIHVPQLKGIKTDGGKSSGKIRWNVNAVDQLMHAFQEIEAQGLLADILTFDGAFNARVKRNGSTLSNHAYGTAIDLNAQWNWLGDEPAKVGQKGSLARIVPIFKTHGFHWGGDWTSPKDGMHFEVARIVNYDGQPEPEEEEEVKKGPLLVIDDNWKKAIPITLVNGQSMVSAKALQEFVGEKWEGPDKQIPAGQALITLGYKFEFNNKQKKLYAYKRTVS